MRDAEQERQEGKPLAYRLLKSVKYYDSNDRPVLVRNFPLMVMILHPFWRPIFECLAEGNFVTFEQILSSVNYADPEKTEIFLNGLVLKGFLELIKDTGVVFSVSFDAFNYIIDVI